MDYRMDENGVITDLNVFKSGNQNPQSFFKTLNCGLSSFPRAGSTSSLTNRTAEHVLYCASTDTNRQPRIFPTDFSSNYAQKTAEDRNE
ncbi:hypothetical protein TNCV_923891 [Trichonephila clavipes]|nr:hypothetical protein TNCV_923891 [Trichonephila clavipes]